MRAQKRKPNDDEEDSQCAEKQPEHRQAGFVGATQPAPTDPRQPSRDMSADILNMIVWSMDRHGHDSRSSDERLRCLRVPFVGCRASHLAT